MTMPSLYAVGTELDKILIGVLPLYAILGGKRSVRNGRSTPHGHGTMVINKISLVIVTVEDSLYDSLHDHCGTR